MILQDFATKAKIANKASVEISEEEKRLIRFLNLYKNTATDIAIANNILKGK